MNEEKPKHQMRLKVQKNNPNPDALKYYIKTLNDLYQTANLENYKRLFKALKDTFELTLKMEEAMKESYKDPETYVKVNLTGWEWIDD